MFITQLLDYKISLGSSIWSRQQRVKSFISYYNAECFYLFIRVWKIPDNTGTHKPVRSPTCFEQWQHFFKKRFQLTRREIFHSVHWRCDKPVVTVGEAGLLNRVDGERGRKMGKRMKGKLKYDSFQPTKVESRAFKSTQKHEKRTFVSKSERIQWAQVPARAWVCLWTLVYVRTKA